MTARRRHFAAGLLSACTLMVLVAGAWCDPDPSAATGTPPDLSAGAPVAGGPVPAPRAVAQSAPGSGIRPPATTRWTGSSRPPARAVDNAAQRLRTLPPETRQVLIVSSDAFDSTTATLSAFGKVGGTWHAAFPPMQARIGAAGFADRKAEGDLKTPTGVYAIGDTMYGIAADPGVRYGYHRLVPDDWWNENPASPGYNSFVHGPNPGGASEALWQISPQYRHFAVVNYNIPVIAANPPLGSGIFLHVAVPGRATAGCVSLVESDLLAVLRWLEPAAAPRMVLAPRTVLSRY